MRSSASEMNSSEGFKRRMIRPTSSRQVDRNQNYLKMFDIAQNQSTIAAIAKTDLIALQQEINSIDLDKKIRSDQISLSKNYITTVRKWLKEAQNFQYGQEDETKILKALNVDNVSSGFKKLWKIAQYLDNLLVKNNELNAIAFLKYDELFTTLTDGNITPNNKKLNLLGQGFSASSVQMSSIYIERLQDLYSLLTKTKKTQQPTQPSKLRLKQTKDESIKLIAQLQEENKKLNKYLEQMTKQNQLKSKVKAVQIKQPVEVPKQTQSFAKVERSDLDKAVSQISSSYQQKLEDFSSKLKKALDSQAHLKLQIRNYKQMIELSKKQSKQNKPTTSHTQTYEATLKQQLQNMKKGYDNKISKLKQDYNQRQKQLMRKQNQYRIENQKIKFQRQLLMKKYDLTK